MSDIFIYKILKRASGGPNPWHWVEKYIHSESRKDADERANKAHCRSDSNPVFIRKKRFIAKNHGGDLPRHWVNAPCGYFAQRACHECGNFWFTGGCKDRFGDKIEHDEFCHWKKSGFWRPE